MSTNREEDQAVIKRNVEAAIKISAIFVMLYWCYTILSPFLSVVVWGGLIAIIAKPLNDKLEGVLGSRKRASTLLTLAMLAIFIAPTVALVDQASAGAQTFITELQEGSFNIDEPSESIKEWPLVGEKTYAFWYEASTNLDATIKKHQAKITELLKSAASSAAGAGLTVLMFIFSIIISGFFLAGADGSSQFSKKFIVRLAGERGERFAIQASLTIRNVARGIVGVAILQAALAWFGFYLIDFPAAPLFAVLVLVLSIIQINPLVVMVPTAIYVFSYEPSTLIAVVYLVWSIAVGFMDNILKPIIMGKGTDVPMMIIFLGAVGGFIAYGFTGLFIGAAVVVMGYEIFMAWLTEHGSLES